jgi:hypothetical protein
VKTYHDGKPWPVQPKPWVGLTDEDLKAAIPAEPLAGMALASMMRDEVTVAEFRQVINILARTVESKLKEKNT